MTYNPDAVPAEEPIDWDNVTLVPKDGEEIISTEGQGEELTLAPIENFGEGIESAKEEIGEIAYEESPSPEAVATQAAAEAEQIETLTTQIHEQLSPEPTKETAVEVSKEVELGTNINYAVPNFRSGDIWENGAFTYNNSDSRKFSGESLMEMTGGAIHYEEGKGFTYENGTAIPSEKAKELASKLNNESAQRFKEASDYVSSGSKKSWLPQLIEKLSLDDPQSVRKILNERAMVSQRSREMITATSVVGGTASLLGGIGAIALGGAGSALAVTAGPLLLGGAAALMAGGAAVRFGKGLYDGYKQRKAEKNFMSAYLAKSVRDQLSRG